MKKNLSLFLFPILFLFSQFKGLGQAVCNNWLYLPVDPSYVEIGDLNIPGNQLTVEANINRTTPYAYNTYYDGDIVGKYRGPADVNYLLRPDNGYITTTDGTFYATPNICPLELNKTYHVAMVYDGSTLKFYRNGFLMSQVAATGNLYQNSYETEIGLYLTNVFPSQFIGYINEVRIWNVARTQSQIQAYMNTSLPSPATQTGLLAYYTFDNLLNKQGNPTWNGTLNGSTSIKATNPTCSAFVADNNCCPALQGTLTGGTICSNNTTALLAYHANNGTGPFTLSYSDGTNTYTQTGVQSDIPFAVQTTPLSTKTYTILTIQDNSTSCAATPVSGIAGTIIVNMSPNSDFTFDQNICNPLNVTFSGISQTGTSYIWTINGINYPGNSSQNQSFLDTGTYPVKLKTVAPNGCTDSTLKNISILFNKGNIINTGDTTICAGHSIQLLAKPALEYCWTPTNYLDNPGLASPTATPPAMTKYYLTGKTVGTNLITNGDFEAGNTGFTSAYLYDPANRTSGEYFVGTNPASWYSGMSTCKDHTTGNGSGNMLLINGSGQLNVEVWTETVSVQANTNYAFSAWIQNITTANPAVLQFSINGQPLGSKLLANINSCIWDQFYTTWNSGNTTTAIISIVNENQGYSGNDFALDDISFAPVTLLQDSVVVNVENSMVTANPDTTVCPGSPVRLKAVGSLAISPFTYSWSPSDGLSDSTSQAPIALPSVTTAYTVTATTAHGCTAKYAVVLTLFPRVNIGLTPDTTICPGTSLQLQASGGSAYTWNPAQYLDNPLSNTPKATPQDTTRLFVTVTDINNCSARDSVVVNVRAPILFKAPPGEEICKGSTIMLKSDNSETYIYNWSPGAGLSDPSAPFPIAGPAVTTLYALSISDPVCGRDSSFEIPVTVKPIPEVLAQKSNDIDCAIATSRLSATGAINYLWTPEEGLDNPRIPNPVASIDSTATFIVQGTADNGCSAFDTLTVNVTATGKNLFVVPNAFTPNGDGHNDCFGIRRWGDVRIEEFSVFNRWGGRVFTTSNPSDCWDGNYNGKSQESGGYVYVIRVWSFCGEITRKGVVMLIR